MKAVIDRFEGDQAVLQCEDGSEIVIPAKLLPAEAAEGDMVHTDFTVERGAGKNLKSSITDIRQRLKKRR